LKSASALSNVGSIGIIGAGVVGLSCAFHLQRAGHRVQIFDFRGPGEAASLGNAGILATSEVFPVARPATLFQVPRMLIDPIGPLVIRWSYMPHFVPWLIDFLIASRPAEVRRSSEALAKIAEPALPAWFEIVKACGAEQFLATNGWLRLYLEDRALKAAADDAPRLRELGVAVEILRGADVADLEPALTAGFAGGVFYPTVGNLTSPLAVTRRIADHITKNGVKFEKREARRVEAFGGHASIVDSTGESTTFDRVIVAAGAWSRQIVRSMGLDVALDTERGYHVMLPTLAQTLRRPVTLPIPGYTLAQMEDGIRLTTGVEFAGLDAPPDFRRVRRMIAHAQRMLHGLDSTPLSEWLGFRPSMPKSMPVIGPLERHPQILLAFGHGHLGMTLGPVTGQIIAAIIAGQAPVVDLAPFLPSRSVR
jgi:D-amino-acid dehydrogenase